MLRNNIQVAFRQLIKNRTYAMLNILGLAVGVTASLLIYRILRYELSFNRNFENRDRIVRVLVKFSGGEKGDSRQRGIPMPAMAAMETSVPQFEQMSRLREDWPTISVPATGDAAPLKKIRPSNAELSYFAEPSFFKIFNFQWIAGNSGSIFREVGDVVLTRKVAEYCFGTCENALGKTVIMDNNVPCTVRGVIENMPPNSDFQLFSLASYATLRAHAAFYDFLENDWGSISSNNQFFALLHDKNQFGAALSSLALVGKTELNPGKPGKRKAVLDLQTLSDMHYDEEVGSAGTHTISRARLGILGSIGFLVLLMACFNFINLATALATLRAREVGVRKAIGAVKGSLVRQFMTETSLIVTLSLVLGTALAAVCKPLLKHVSEVPDTQPFLNDPAVWIFLICTGVLVTLLSGLYPSLVLSGFSPIKALRSNRSTEKSGGVSLRKGLVVTQFVIAQALIIGAIVTVSQLDYLQSMDLGFKKDLVLTTNFNPDSASLAKIAGMKQQLEQIASVEHVSFSSDQPASGSTWASNFALGRGSEDAPFNTSMKFCDADFIKTYGLQMLAGRWFEPGDTTKEYVINETMCRKLGLRPAESAVGKELKLGSGKWRPVVGVVKDFNSHSAHQEHEALVLTASKKEFSSIGIKIRPGNIQATVEAVRKVYDATFPEQVFESTFFDESIAEFYGAETRFSYFCKGIAALAILIGCLGLFGLATHAAARRTKEIGVRKVLGASVASITGLLAIDFLKLVFVAILLASPLAYYLMQKWLADFVFHIDIEWWMFAAACSGAIAVAFFTVSFQSIKAALANPVKSLRSE